jgi:AraC-like DNA-binding protein
MLCATELAAGRGFTVNEVRCGGHARGWAGLESPGSFRLVLVRRGRFRRRVRSGVAELDRTVGYLGVPREEEHFAHPVGGDVCTSVTVAPALWRELVGEHGALPRAVFYVDAGLELAHHRALHAAADVDFALAEQLTALLVGAVQQVVAGPLPGGGRSADADAALVAAARAAILAGHPSAGGLFPLAELLGVSPYRLSRAFPRTVGVTLSRFRNRVRVGRALDRLAQGEPSLATMAADLGFADQAHLTRTVREHLGDTPTAVRRLLAASSTGDSPGHWQGVPESGCPSAG